MAHADVHDAWTVSCLEQMATTVLRFQPVDMPGSEQQRECEILNKRPSGRITLEVTHGTHIHTSGTHRPPVLRG